MTEDKGIRGESWLLFGREVGTYSFTSFLNTGWEGNWPLKSSPHVFFPLHLSYKANFEGKKNAVFLHCELRCFFSREAGEILFTYFYIFSAALNKPPKAELMFIWTCGGQRE